MKTARHIVEAQMRELIITIPGRLPKELNPNWQPRSEGSRYIKAGAITSLKNAAFLYAVHARNEWEKQQGKPWVSLDQASIQVVIAITARMKPWDSTNARGALKYMEDSLVKAQIIQDDNPVNLTWHDIQWIRGREQEIEVRVSGNSRQRAVKLKGSKENGFALPIGA